MARELTLISAALRCGNTQGHGYQPAMEVGIMTSLHRPHQLILRFWRNSPRNPTACAYCGAVFVPARATRRFCSNSCSRRANPPSAGFTNGGSFKSGQRPWNAGKTGSEHHWRGRHHHAESKRKMAAAMQGEMNPNWRGGISPENERARKVAAYGEWRRQVFARDDYTCVLCGARSAKGKRVLLQADHVRPFALYPDLRYDPANGRTLCAPCHRQTPTYGAKQATGKEARKVS